MNIAIYTYTYISIFVYIRMCIYAYILIESERKTLLQSHFYKSIMTLNLTERKKAIQSCLWRDKLNSYLSVIVTPHRNNNVAKDLHNPLPVKINM
jgi:hypothetical protein